MNVMRTTTQLSGVTQSHLLLDQKKMRDEQIQIRNIKQLTIFKQQYLTKKCLLQGAI